LGIIRRRPAQIAREQIIRFYFRASAFKITRARIPRVPARGRVLLQRRRRRKKKDRKRKKKGGKEKEKEKETGRKEKDKKGFLSYYPARKYNVSSYYPPLPPPPRFPELSPGHISVILVEIKRRALSLYVYSRLSNILLISHVSRLFN